jgi:hypothetical protein
MKKIRVICLISAVSFLLGCTKEIDLTLDSTTPQLVIEGIITDQPGPYEVKLSKTVNFDESNIYPPVSGAIVVISDNTGLIDTLSETSSGVYTTHTITGVQGYTYTLKVWSEGESYEAVSTMPTKVSFDAIQFDQFDDPGETTQTFAIVPLFYDPLEFGNCYRFFFTSNGVPDKAYQVTNDNIGNGTLNQQPFFSDDLKFYQGDTVKVEMLCISTSAYNYFYTLSQISESGPGGGAAPSNPPNNISGNTALGYFSAHTTETRIGVIE